MTSERDRSAAAEEVAAIVERGDEADDVLRGALGVLSRLYPFVAIRFAEEGDFVEGPSIGTRQDAERRPIRFREAIVAELEVAGAGPADHAFLDRVTSLLGPHCLVGWDTGGERWDA